MPNADSADWVRLPLSHGQVFSSSSDRAGLLRGLSLTSPCNPRLLSLHGHMLTFGKFGPARSLLRHISLPEIVAGALGSVLASAEAECGAFGEMAVATARQPERPHFVALISTPTRDVFLKSTTKQSESAFEAAVLSALDGGVDALRTPRLIASGSCGGQHWLATEAMPTGRHMPVWDYPGEAIAVLTDRLQNAALPTIDTADGGRLGSEAAGGSTFAHGDLAPWNLRKIDGVSWLIDWADGRIASAKFDQTYFAVAAAAMGAPLPLEKWDVDARDEVLEVVDERLGRGGSTLDLAMAAILR